MNIHVLVDGLGWTIAEDLPSFDFLEGRRRSLETVLGFSSSAIPTILTGAAPEEHGIWNLFRYDPEHTDFPLFRGLGRFSGWLDRSRLARKAALVANRLFTGFEGYYQAYEVPAELLGSLSISERHNLYRPGGTGSTPSLFDTWASRGARWVSASWRDGAKTDSDVLRVARSKILRHNPEEVFIYLAGFDAFGHRNAGDPRAMREETSRIARQLEDLLRFCRSLKASSQMHVFSDHGMLPLEGTVDLRLPLAGIPPEERTWTCLLDATMARFWWKDGKSRQMVHEAFSGLPGHFLSESELGMHRVRFDGRYGDSIWLADPGIQIVPSHMASVPLGGMHGYDPSHPLMKASFLTSSDRRDIPSAIWDLHGFILDDPSRSDRRSVAAPRNIEIVSSKRRIAA